MTEDSRQQSLVPFREMNHYDGLDDDWPSDEVYLSPKRTLANGWAKFHADRGCGRRKLHYVEMNGHRPTSDRYEYEIYCYNCGYRIPEEEILFIGGDWWSENGWMEYGRPLEDIFLPPDRVLELGPAPDEDDLIHALNLARIEREAGPHLGIGIREDQFRECDSCGSEVPLIFDGKCRMCYDGEWTDRMQDSLNAFENKLRIQNNSFVHRLEMHIDPLSTNGMAGKGEVLYRRHAQEPTTKLVIVTKRLEDIDDGHREYELWDPTYTERYRYREEDLAACFWSTGLYDPHRYGVGDDDIREAYQHVCEHTFSDVHDLETLDPDGEQCLHCRIDRSEVEDAKD